MGAKAQMFVPKGMKRDYSESKADPQFAFENHNIRITPTNGSTLLSITNEKGNKNVPIHEDSFNFVRAREYYVDGDSFTTFIIELDRPSQHSFAIRVDAAGLGGSPTIVVPAGVTYYEEVYRDHGELNASFSLIRDIRLIGTDGIKVISTVYYWQYLLPSEYIGYSNLNDYLVLFFTGKTDTGEQRDFIIRTNIIDDKLYCKVLVAGDLGFSVDHPIETLSLYENENIQKVYWVDGIHQPRMINIVAPSQNTNSAAFDFVREHWHTKVSVNKSKLGGGNFTSGVVQYVVTYYDLYGSETHPVFVSDLLYLSPYGRGGKVDEKNNSSFDITISPEDGIPYQFARIYSIVRTSLDATPATKLVASIPLDRGVGPYTFTDRNTSGSDISPSDLLYKGGDPIRPYTMTHKDGTLFLGNYTLDTTPIPETLKAEIKESSKITFLHKEVDIQIPLSGAYPYLNTLDRPSSEIKTFHSNECYRFGIQLLHRTGVWSEVIFVGDARVETLDEEGNTIPLSIEQTADNLNLIKAKIAIPKTVLQKLPKDYIEIRGAVVYPDIATREVVCQGILCPTVYSGEGRLNNRPYAQSSWFARPNPPYRTWDNVAANYDISKEVIPDEIITWDEAKGYWGRVYRDKSEKQIKSSHLANMIINKVDLTQIQGTGTSGATIPIIPPKGIIREFRHNRGLPHTSNRNAEIQYTKPDDSNAPINAYVGPTTISSWGGQFFVDQSIVTLHSPDIEFNDAISHLDLANIKLRIVGYSSVTGNQADQEIIADTPGREIKNIFSQDSPNRSGMRITGANTGWLEGNKHWITYPWHRTGSLNGGSAPTGGDKWPAKLESKILSNLTVSTETTYLRNIWYRDKPNSLEEVPEENEIVSTGISGVSIYKNDGNPMLKVAKQENGTLVEDILYYGEVNKIFYPSGSDSTEITPYPICWLENDEIMRNSNITGVDPIEFSYKSSPHAVIALNYSTKGRQVILPSNYEVTDTASWHTTRPEIIPTGNTLPINKRNILTRDNKTPFWHAANKQDVLFTFVTTDTIPANITSPHGPLGKYIWKGKHNVTGYIYEWKLISNFPIKLYGYSKVTTFAGGELCEDITNTPSIIRKIVKVNIPGVPQGYILVNPSNQSSFGVYQETMPITTDYAYFWVGELYRDMPIADRFGGTSEEVLKGNTWLPGTITKPLTDTKEDMLEIELVEGDTYYQRYDCLKTYAYDNKKPNSIVDIVSFMCETRINIDGRHDKNRGNLSNLTASPENFNLLNPIYSQQNSFFPSQYIDSKRFDLFKFPNSIAWTRTKIAGEEIDSWTQLSLLSTMDLDGDKGDIEALKRFNNELYCFQPLGISRIFFNSHAQMLTQGIGSNPVPVELMNSGKVEGKAYITTGVGSSNKWSIVTTPKGMYFIDNLTNSIQLFSSEGMSDLSDKLAFRTWVDEINTLEKWNSRDFNNIITFYDSTNSDIYFISKSNKSTVVYSELIGQFTSFFDYNEVPLMVPINGKFYSFKGGVIWEQYAGDYNSFFGTIKPYSVEIICNMDSPVDKIFNTVEWRATIKEDGKDSTSTFDTIKVTTDGEYQSTGEAKITNRVNSNIGGMFNNGSPTLRRKFRIWRTPIPRDSSNGRDRIRGPWANIKLSKEDPKKEKMELHDLVVHFFE